MTVKFFGDGIGVAVHDRGTYDLHQCFTILIEDNETWRKKLTISSFWLEEAIAQLQAAKEYLDATCQKDDWGYRRQETK